MIWSDGEGCGDLGTTSTTTSSAEECDATREICFTLGGVGSKPLNGNCNNYNMHKHPITVTAIFVIIYHHQHYY